MITDTNKKIFDRRDVFEYNNDIIFVKTSRVSIGHKGRSLDRNLTSQFNNFMKKYSIEPENVTEDDIDVFIFNFMTENKK